MYYVCFKSWSNWLIYIFIYKFSIFSSFAKITVKQTISAPNIDWLLFSYRKEKKNASYIVHKIIKISWNRFYKIHFATNNFLTILNYIIYHITSIAWKSNEILKEEKVAICITIESFYTLYTFSLKSCHHFVEEENRISVMESNVTRIIIPSRCSTDGAADVSGKIRKRLAHKSRKGYEAGIEAK